MMNLEDIKQKISHLAQKHSSIPENDLSDFGNAEILESEAFHLIVDYSESQGYLINGFPTEIRNRYENDEISDTLTLQKDDVAELMWHYANSFWPDQFESKEDYIDSIKIQIESGVFYDVIL
ncbi:MAG: hypothetical protein EBX50_21160 [Chitinophagia bacterium]|nr:hypothetical protein [Chitinophagia bacterium]